MDDESCQRCGQRIKGKPAVLAIDREGVPLDGSPLSLCAHCVASYERWLRRRRKIRPPSNAEIPVTRPERPARRPSTRRSFWRKKRRVLIGIGFLLAALIGSALLMTVVIRNFERSQAAAEAGP